MRKLIFLLLAAFVSGAQAQSCCDQRTANPPAFTWATKPTCNTASNGRQIRVTDVGTHDWIAVCDGANSFWTPVGGRVLLYQFNTPTTFTGVQADTVVGSTVTVPGGLLGANGSWVSEITLSGITNTGNAKTTNIRWGSTSGSSCTSNVSLNSQTNASTVKAQLRFSISNATASTQNYWNFAMTTPYGTSTVSAGTATVNTANDSYICWTQAVTTAAEVIRWDHIEIWATPAP